MAVKLDHVAIHQGESIFLNLKGSAECGILVSVRKDGRCFIQGPHNTESRTLELTANGLTDSTEDPLNVKKPC